MTIFIGIVHPFRLIIMNMFTKNVKPRRGRPPGESAKGAAARQQLYETAVGLIAKHGYDATTLRDVAQDAGVSVGLLYRYFPSKRAVVRALYDQLSDEYARAAAEMPRGKWRERFLFALNTSLEVLAPHRIALEALIPVLVGAGDDGLFAAGTAFSRLRVQRVFEGAVIGSTDAPPQPLAQALGRVLYLAHVLVLLWWLLDRTPRQRATIALVALFREVLPFVSMTLRLPAVRRFVVSSDALIGEALFGNPAGD
jgi:AcrR family transcriptional regulator